ncbi:AAA family ATPase [Streptomyces flavovirens]|uniref:AAA family ATPase n=1 Tax=Streptomyces flavovirens TaxID=52258 RepID=UPI003D1484C3
MPRHKVTSSETVLKDHKRITEALREALGDKVRVQGDSKQRVRVEHRTGAGVFPLDLRDESSGARTWIGLVGPVITTLADGGVLCVDELDARLHPYLVDALVGMFQSRDVNRAGAQLVVSTHEAALLDGTCGPSCFAIRCGSPRRTPGHSPPGCFP